LRNALVQLDHDSVCEALDQIHARDAHLAGVLRALAGNFQYGTILRMLDNGRAGWEESA